jgi:HEAT repeat protein
VTDPPQTGPMVKREVCRLLGCSDLDVERGWARLPALKTVNALFSFLYSTDPQVKWCAVQAMGKAGARLADEDLEAARNVVRRLMWSLNDESGGIGWGAGEAMGEILARHDDLAREYTQILLSYARSDGNLLDNDGLLQGVLWGLTRVAEVRPELLSDAARHITMHLQSSDASIRALAVDLLGLLGDASARDRLAELAADRSEVTLFLRDCEQRVRIADLVARVLGRLG